MGMLTREAIEAMGFASIGENIQISGHASFYGTGRISIGSNVRIDDFCVISAGAGGILIGDHVHIAAGASMIGAGKITMSDFSGLSSRTSVYSSSDDYSGDFLTNPTVPSRYTNVTNADVFFGKHVIVGSGSVILPGAILEEGVAIGALSLVNDLCEAFWIYAGTPARKIKERGKCLLTLESELSNSPNTRFPV